MNSRALCWIACMIIAHGALAQVDDGEINRTPPPKVQPVVPAVVQDEPADGDTASPEEDPVITGIDREWDKEDASDAVAAVDSSESAPGTPGKQVGEDGPRSFTTVLLQGTMALFGTVALILLLLAAVKRWGKRSPLLAGHSLGRVMGRIALSPQASLHFIRIQDEVLVVGVTQQNVNLIQTLDAHSFDAEEVVVPAPKVRAGSADFLSQLQSSQATLSDSSTAMDEELDSLKGDLQRLQQYFQESTRARD